MTQTSTDPLAVVEAFLEAFAAMDFDTALGHIAVGAVDGPHGNVGVLGPDGVRSVLEPFFAPIDANEFVLLRKAAAGPVVFLERLDRHRIGSDWRELPVNSVFEVDDGKITVWRDYFDLATAAMIHQPSAT